MRILVFILLLVCVSATIIPCCSFDNCSDDISVAASPAEKETEEGNCSPFFTCAGCPVAVVATRGIELSAPVFVMPSFDAFHPVSRLSYYTSSFWQPPRLG